MPRRLSRTEVALRLPVSLEGYLPRPLAKWPVAKQRAYARDWLADDKRSSRLATRARRLASSKARRIEAHGSHLGGHLERMGVDEPSAAFTPPVLVPTASKRSSQRSVEEYLFLGLTGGVGLALDAGLAGVAIHPMGRRVPVSLLGVLAGAVGAYATRKRRRVSNYFVAATAGMALGLGNREIQRFYRDRGERLDREKA